MTERKDGGAPFLQITDNGSDSAFIRVIGLDKEAWTQLWHWSFTGTSGRCFFDDVASRTGAYIRADWKTRTLRLSAEGSTRQNVIRLVKAEIALLEFSERSVAINKRAGSLFLRTGPPRLDDRSQNNMGSEAYDALCPICFDEVSHSVVGTSTARHASDIFYPLRSKGKHSR